MVRGEITSNEIAKADIAKTYIWRASAEMSPGVKLFGEANWPTIDAKWAFPLEVDGEFPVPEGAVARRARIQYVEFGAVMEMAEFRWMITDWAKARAMEMKTHTDMQRRGAEYIAKCQNRQILDALYAGAGATTVTVGAGSEWDTNAAGVDIEGDILDAWGYIIDESNCTEDEMKQIGLIYPAKVAGKLKTLRLIENVQQTLEKYLGSSLDLTLHPTRYYNETTSVGIQDDAVLFIKGEYTLRHAAYRGDAIPMSEVVRVFGRGVDYLVKKMFFSKVEPDTQTDATSDRICKIANVI